MIKEGFNADTPEKGFRILYTSDIHGRLFSSYGEPGLETAGQAFCKDGNTLIFDGGDILQGGPAGAFLASRKYEGTVHPAAMVLNSCGYDAVTLGNHDFNYGISYLAGYLRSLKASCLCANIHDNLGRLPVRDTKIFTLENGLRIGVFGLCTDALTGWERGENLENLWIEEPLSAGRHSMQKLRGRCDVTVCIYHGGFEEEADREAAGSRAGENAAGRLCRELQVDLMLTGHQHLLEPGRMLDETYVVQPGCFAKYYSVITGILDKDGKITFSSRLEKVSVSEVRSEGMVPLAFRSALERWKREPVCTLPAPVPMGDWVCMALYGSALADFINKIQLAITGAQISATCLSNTAAGLPGVVHVEDIFRTYTSANTLCVVRINGEDLRRALEWTAEFLTFRNGAYRIDSRFLRPKPRYFHYDFYAGIDYQIDFTRPAGSRLAVLNYDGKPVEPADTFTICITSYRRAGGDGYDMFRKAELLSMDAVPMAERMIQFLRQEI